MEIPPILTVSLLTGRILGLFFIPFFRSQFFFLFPTYHIGGAEKVHIKIVHCLRKCNPIVFFTNRSRNSALKKQFMQSARTLDFGHFNYFDNLVYVDFWIGVLCTIINNNKTCVVFGCNNVLFYRLIPHLKPQICCIDLLHAFGGGIEDVSLPYVNRLNKRIVINKRTVNDLRDQYQLNNIAEKMNERIFLIENCVRIPEEARRKNDESILRVLYVGRGSEEKRVHLIGIISHLCYLSNLPIEFILVGDVKDSVDEEYRRYCNFLGEVENEEQISELYSNSDILLLVSSREGFPLVIMEAMAHGIVTISTDVGGISEHIFNGHNGFLIKNESEDVIVKNAFKVLSKLASNKSLMDNISHEAYEYAKTNFNCKKFCSEYKNLIWGKNRFNLKNEFEKMEQLDSTKTSK
jgi:glycosyltransferase involved in cell wall biosynthesis